MKEDIGLTGDNHIRVGGGMTEVREKRGKFRSSERSGLARVPPQP